MNASVSSDETVSSPLLEEYSSMPPASMRSSKSVVNQVKETLFSFLKKVAVPGVHDESQEEDSDRPTDIQMRFSPEVVYSRSQKQRTKEAFSERIATFTIPNWMGKPLTLSPPLLAQYGWQCIGLDTVKCCSCAAIFSVRLPWPDADNYRQQCLTYRHKVLNAHMKICSWPSYPCPDSFVSPFLHGGSGASQVRADFVERKNHLMLLKEKLPQLQEDILNDLNMDLSQLLNVLCSHIDTSHTDQAEDNAGSHLSSLSQEAVAAILAMCGWDTSCTTSSNFHNVFCKSSGRNVGLWNFFKYGEASLLSEPAEETSNCGSAPEVLSESVGSKRPAPTDTEDTWSPKRIKSTEGTLNLSPSHLKIQKKYFHPLQQHYPWSSWVAVLKPISQDELEEDAGEDKKYHHIVNPFVEGAKPGWVVVRDTLLRKKFDEEAAEIPSVTEQLDTEDTPKKLDKANTGSLALAAVRTPPKTAIVHVRKLLREWSSPK